MLDEVIFLKKLYEVICIINFKTTLFKGFTRGDPWVHSLVKQNFNRTKFMKSLQSEDVIHGMGGLIRTLTI